MLSLVQTYAILLGALMTRVYLKHIGTKNLFTRDPEGSGSYLRTLRGTQRAQLFDALYTGPRGYSYLTHFFSLSQSYVRQKRQREMLNKT